MRNRNDGGFGLTKVGDMAFSGRIFFQISGRCTTVSAGCHPSGNLDVFGDFAAQEPLSGPLGSIGPAVVLNLYSPVCFYCF